MLLQTKATSASWWLSFCLPGWHLAPRSSLTKLVLGIAFGFFLGVGWGGAGGGGELTNWFIRNCFDCFLLPILIFLVESGTFYRMLWFEPQLAKTVAIDTLWSYLGCCNISLLTRPAETWRASYFHLLPFCCLELQIWPCSAAARSWGQSRCSRSTGQYRTTYRCWSRSWIVCTDDAACWLPMGRSWSRWCYCVAPCCLVWIHFLSLQVRVFGIMFTNSGLYLYRHVCQFPYLPGYHKFIVSFFVQAGYHFWITRPAIFLNVVISAH